MTMRIDNYPHFCYTVPVDFIAWKMRLSPKLAHFLLSKKVNGLSILVIITPLAMEAFYFCLYE